MCGRFSLLTNVKALIERFGIQVVDSRPSPRYNIAPSQSVSVIIENEGRRMVEMRWGLIPHWAKDSKIGNKMINARVESLLSKGIFKPALRSRRCLILADGFYEWQMIGKVKKPMHIRLKSREPFAFAGLFENWRSPTEKIIQSCTIITTTSNDLMAPIHDRMPVILERTDEADWLTAESTDPTTLVELLKPYESAPLEAYEVSTFVNSPANEGSECIRPIDQTFIQ
ncbi:MAG: SOS response-associated peptidase [Candidatus Thorarchaeota archaeon]